MEVDQSWVERFAFVCMCCVARGDRSKMPGSSQQRKNKPLLPTTYFLLLVTFSYVPLCVELRHPSSPRKVLI